MTPPPRLPDDVRASLLALARGCIAARARGSAAPACGSEAPLLAEPRGVFVTLRRHSDGELRGCVGIPEPRFPLRDAVVHAALGAAFGDPRFGPVEPDELEGLDVQVSVLGPIEPAAPESIVTGVHGLLIRRGRQSGLLLPQVAAEQGWDRETFLTGVCRKAGLPLTAWKDPGCALYAFTAECFGETGEEVDS